VTKRIAGTLLAAGGRSRLGRPKALVEFRGRTLAERGVALLRDGGVDPVLVVTGSVPRRELRWRGHSSCANPRLNGPAATRCSTYDTFTLVAEVN
jgi:CTP:molybdopterin cytidylyltransferase MocA